MNINDETLSAFLDAELSEAEMEAVRAAIVEDESVANRLAELAGVDNQIRACYQSIDAQPMPEAITNMIAASTKQHSAQTKDAPIRSAKIFHFPRFEPQHLAMAASVTLAIGIAMNYWLGTEPNQGAHWQEVAQALDNLPSGVTRRLSSGAEFVAKVSFNNQEGQLCRQYQANEPGNVTQGIACYSANAWQSVASLTLTESLAGTGEQYQTASNDKAIVERVDAMAVGSFLNREQEARAIAKGWNTNTHNHTTDK